MRSLAVGPAFLIFRVSYNRPHDCAIQSVEKISCLTSTLVKKKFFPMEHIKFSKDQPSIKLASWLDFFLFHLVLAFVLKFSFFGLKKAHRQLVAWLRLQCVRHIDSSNSQHSIQGPGCFLNLYNSRSFTQLSS